jgi:hypothetical protein
MTSMARNGISSLPWLCQKEELQQEIAIVPRSESDIR